MWTSSFSDWWRHTREPLCLSLRRVRKEWCQVLDLQTLLFLSWWLLMVRFPRHSLALSLLRSVECRSGDLFASCIVASQSVNVSEWEKRREKTLSCVAGNKVFLRTSSIRTSLSRSSRIREKLATRKSFLSISLSSLWQEKKIHQHVRTRGFQ